MACKIFLLALCLFGVALQTQSFAIRSDTSDGDEADVQQYDTRFIEVDVDGEQYKLTLKSSQREVIFANTPVWTVSSSGEGYQYTEVTNEKYIDGVYYNDAEFMATLLATYNENEREIFYDGVVGVQTKVHVVRSSPEKWWKVVPIPADSDEVEDHTENDKEQSKETQGETLRLRSSYVPGEKVGELEKPLSVLHPKIVVVVDYKLFQQLGGDIQKTVKYVATFYNAIDLRYGKLYGPYVELLVTGIVIVTDEQTGLVENARDYFSQQFVRDIDFTNYDSAFIMTTTNTKAIQGQSHLGSICNRAYSTAFIQDDATFGGLLTATHELGHLLNLPHDGSDEAESCKVESGDATTVMAPSEVQANIVGWSHCSRYILQEFAKSQAAECLEYTYRYE